MCRLPLIDRFGNLRGFDSGGFGPHQVRKPGKSAPGAPCQKMQIFTNISFKAPYKIFAESDVSTRCENPAKVRLVGIGLQIYSGCYHAGGHCHLKNGKLFMYAEASLFFWWQHPIVATSILSARIEARYPLERYSQYPFSAIIT